MGNILLLSLTFIFSCRILQKTTDYLEHFARFRRKENVEAVERLLTAQKGLAKFERAQLGTFYYSCSPKFSCLRREVGSDGVRELNLGSRQQQRTTADCDCRIIML